MRAKKTKRRNEWKHKTNVGGEGGQHSAPNYIVVSFSQRAQCPLVIPSPPLPLSGTVQWPHTMALSMRSDPQALTAGWQAWHYRKEGGKTVCIGITLHFFSLKTEIDSGNLSLLTSGYLHCTSKSFSTEAKIMAECFICDDNITALLFIFYIVI